MTITVVIADDQPVMRTGLRMILQAHDDIEVVAEAGDGKEAVEMVRMHQPDVVLMDIQMPGTDGIEATRLLAAEQAPSRVLILTTFGLDAYVYDALQGGAAGFLLKTDEPPRIVDGIRTVAAGEALLAPQITRHLIAEYLVARRDPARPPPPEVATLTDRERDVLTELARGRSNAEIGRELFISEGTVKTHVARILDKLLLRDRVQAVVFAYQHGLGPTPDQGP